MIKRSLILATVLALAGCSGNDKSNEVQANAMGPGMMGNDMMANGMMNNGMMNNGMCDNCGDHMNSMMPNGMMRNMGATGEVPANEHTAHHDK